MECNTVERAVKTEMDTRIEFKKNNNNNKPRSGKARLVYVFLFVLCQNVLLYISAVFDWICALQVFIIIINITISIPTT